MKTVRNSLVWMLAILLSGVAFGSQAQGRGHGDNPGQGHNKENHQDRSRDKHHDDKKYDDRNHNDRNRYDYDHRGSHHDYSSNHDRYYRHGSYVTYNHRHRGYSWAPAYGYRYNTRYIYYRDYNIYYDCYRDVFVVWTGRNWVISAVVPAVIYRVDFNRAAVVGVDYWDDDFNFYLARRRPAYVSISASW